MKKIKKFRIKSFSRSSGQLIPLSFNKKFPIKVKRIFFYTEKKIKLEASMLIKNVLNFLFLFTER